MELANTVERLREQVDELRQAHVRMEFALRSAHASPWEYDHRSGELLLSGSWDAGRGQAPARSRTSFSALVDSLPPGDREQGRALLDAVLNGLRDECSLEQRIEAADASVRWVLWHGRVVERHPLTGRALRMIGISMDITDRKRAEQLADAEKSRTARSLELSRVLLTLAEQDVSPIGRFLQVATEAAAQALQVERAGIWLQEDGGKGLVCRDLYRASDASHEQGFTVDAQVHARYFAALAEGEPMSATDTVRDSGMGDLFPGGRAPRGAASTLDAPMRLGARLLGVIRLERAHGDEGWSEEDRQFAQTLARMVAHAVADSERNEAQRMGTALFYHSPAGTAFVGDQRVLLMCNERMEQMFGYAQGELKGQCDRVLYHSDEQWLSHADVFGAAAGSQEREAQMRVKSGESIWVLMRGRPIEAGPKGSSTLISYTDITVRKRAEQALEQLNHDLGKRALQRARALTQSEARFGVVIAEAPVGIAILRDECITEANPRLCSLLGYERVDLIGRPLAQFSHAQGRADDPAAPLPDRAAVETRYRHRSGRDVWAHVRVSVLPGRPGEKVHRVVVVEDITERRKADQQLREYASHVSALSGRLLAAQEEERRQLSRELHDEIGQVLTAVRMVLVPPRSDSGRPALGEPWYLARSVVDDAIVRVRTMSMNLRPPVLDDLGLLPAVRELCNRHRELARMAVDLETLGDLAQLPSDLVVTLYRVCQEALTNVSRHARASRVEVRLGVSEGQAVLIVRDNGVGFDPESAAAAGRLGIVGMRERVKARGGTLDVDSQPGRGTALMVLFRLAEPPGAYSSGSINPLRTA
ncbi:PAS domain S-box protein [Ramlibacter tataouinensis]|nr:PAS domain S-box protein [Ramlibacter tataouinensis]